MLEHGVTYAGSDEGAFALNDAVAGSVRQATIKGYQLVLRAAMSYESVFRSEGKEQAFEETTKYIVMNMMDSMYKKLEVELGSYETCIFFLFFNCLSFVVSTHFGGYV